MTFPRKSDLPQVLDRSAMTAKEMRDIGYPEAIRNLEDVQLLYGQLISSVKTPEGKEIFVHGLSRRLGTLVSNLNRILKISPPTRVTKLTGIERADLTAHLHCFFINHFGVYNNLAAVWCYERLSEKDRCFWLKQYHKLNIFNKDFRKCFPTEMVELLNQFDVWYENLTDFRHPLAHMVPFYVIPFFMNPEDIRKNAVLEASFLKAKTSVEMEIISDLQDSLGQYLGGHMTGSFNKNKVMPIHQIVADINTLLEILKLYARLFSQGQAVGLRKK